MNGVYCSKDAVTESVDAYTMRGTDVLTDIPRVEVASMHHMMSTDGVDREGGASTDTIWISLGMSRLQPEVAAQATPTICPESRLCLWFFFSRFCRYSSLGTRLLHSHCAFDHISCCCSGSTTAECSFSITRRSSHDECFVSTGDSFL